MVSNEKEFWSAGRSGWNRWQIRRAAVDTPTEYELVEDLGPAVVEREGVLIEPIKDVGIEYDGNFRLTRTGTVVQLHTTANPWIFVLMTDGRLYVKRAGIDIHKTPPILLSASAVSASLCRSWKNQAYNADQGLILGYVLGDGTVWYREYHKIDASMGWDEAIQIPTDVPESNVKVFRLNDFRVSIFLRNNRKLLISSRTYIGNTLKDESLRLWAREGFWVSSFRNTLTESPDILQNVSIEFLSDTLVACDFNFPVFDYDSYWKDITWSGIVPAGQEIKSLDWSHGDEGRLIIELKIPMPNPRMALSFTCRTANRKGYYISDQAKPIWPGMTWSKAQEPLTVEVQNQGRADVYAETRFISWGILPRTVYNSAEEERLAVNLVTQIVQLENQKVTYLTKPVQEPQGVIQTTSLISFDCTQSGVTPV